MNLVCKLANKAYKKLEVPVGAVIVYKDRVIASSYNLRESKQIATYHAEILAINKANKKLKSWRLEDAIMYVSLEPCGMCKNAIMQTRIKKVYYLARDLKNLESNSIIDCVTPNFSNQTEFEYLDDSGFSSELIKNFFKEIRNNK